MKFRIIIISFFLVALTLASCLEGDPINTDPDAAFPILAMTNNPNGSGIVNSGLQYFGNQALLYPPTQEEAVAVFAVSLQGVAKFSKDINVTLSTPNDALDDYYSSDSINYTMMPATYFEFINTTGVIKAGEQYAEFKVKFFPSKMDFTKNTMLPITASNDAGLPMASNFGFVYYHVVGNPIAGLYNWDFIRCSTPTCSAGPDGTSFSGEETVLAPANPTTVRTPTGYYTGPDYIITFEDDGAGTLTNFKAVLDPDKVNTDWATAGVFIATGPNITVENNYTKYTIKYTTLTRNCTDIYYK